MMNPLLKIKYFFAYGDYSRRAQDLAPAGSAPPYAAFQALKYHSWGVVLEKNWGNRAKLVLESNFICSTQENNPWVKGVNTLAEMNYLLTYHFSLRAVGYYSYSFLPSGASYHVQSVSGGLSYRFQEDVEMAIQPSLYRVNTRVVIVPLGEPAHTEPAT